VALKIDQAKLTITSSRAQGDRARKVNMQGIKTISKSRPWQRFVLILLVLVMANGCATANSYKRPVARFENGVKQTADTVEPYFTRINWIDSQNRLLDKACEGQNWNINDLTPRFDPETIQARVKALQVIRKYARLLADIAGSEAPGTYMAAAAELRGNSQALLDEVGGLIKKKNMPDIREPLTGLMTFLGEIVIEHQRKQALDSAIKAGEEPVKELIRLLREDTIATTLLWRQYLIHRQIIMFKMYNKERQKAASLEDLTKKVLSDNQEVEALSTFQVGKLFDDLSKAHEALVEFANSEGKRADLASLTEQIEVFTEHAQTVFDLVQSFRNIK